MFSFLTPFVFIGIALIPLAIFIIALIYFIRRKSPILGRVVLLFCALMLLVLPYLPFVSVPTQMDGFRARMATIKPDQWKRFALAARTMAKQDENEEDIWHDYPAIVEALAPNYSFLKLGDWPPRLSFVGKRTILCWGSGLVGSLSVEIWDGEVDSRYYANYDRQPIELYPGVLLTSE